MIGRGQRPRARQENPRPEWSQVSIPVRPALRRYERPRRERFGLLAFIVFTLVMFAVMLVGFTTILRPVLTGVVTSWAYSSSGALGLPFVRTLVVEGLGAELKDTAGTDDTKRAFVVKKGDSPNDIADNLVEEGYLAAPRAFVFTIHDRKLVTKLTAGTFLVSRAMTPGEIVSALLVPAPPTVDILFREGLRLEQIVAKLATTPLEMDPAQFYALAKRPSPDILVAHPWLILPKGASLEGFLAPATYRVELDATPEQLLNQMLDAFEAQMGLERMTVPEKRGLSFYQIVTLASLVEREAVLDSERPTIAGVFVNRLNPKTWPSGFLQADPTVIYAHDSVALAALEVPTWSDFFFWRPFPQLGTTVFPDKFAGYQSYLAKGLPPGPICTPTAASIDAALAPDTKSGYLYFLAKQDGTDAHAFAKTQAEHEANLVKYGYIK